MNTKTYADILKERIRNKYNDYTWVEKKGIKPYEYDKEDPIKDIFDKLKKEQPNITIKDVLKKFKPEELIDAIGIENVEAILRSHKINKLKNNIKKK